MREPELDELERFFRSRGARIAIDFCPLADPVLLESLGRRGYRATEFNNVLVKRLVQEGRHSVESGPDCGRYDTLGS